MAKAPATLKDSAVEAAGATEPCLRITAPGGSRWRAGIQFGRAPVDLGEADIEAAARAKGITPEEVIGLLRADPHLAVVPHRRPIPEAEASPEA